MFLKLLINLRCANPAQRKNGIDIAEAAKQVYPIDFPYSIGVSFILYFIELIKFKRTELTIIFTTYYKIKKREFVTPVISFGKTIISIFNVSVTQPETTK